MNTTETMETMILFRDMCALAPMTQIKPITWIARYEHTLHDGITRSMNKGSGIVRDYSTRALWRWERIEANQIVPIEITNEDNEDDGFIADVAFPWGEVIPAVYYRGNICMDDWQQIILDDLGDGKSSGRFEDDLGTVWKWTTR